MVAVNGAEEQAFSIVTALDEDTQAALFDLLSRKFRAQPSESEVVNATQGRIREQCVCGSIFQATMPAEFRNDLLKGVNTWRKYHLCGMRQYPDQNQSEGS